MSVKTIIESISIGELVTNINISGIDKAKLIATMIDFLTHDELTALIYLMIARKSDIESSLRAKLLAK